jgi:hypothetical protein
MRIAIAVLMVVAFAGCAAPGPAPSQIAPGPAANAATPSETGPSNPPDASPAGTLNVIAIGDTLPVVVQIDGVEVARYGCGVGGAITTGRFGVPPLPWRLIVMRQSDLTVLLSTDVTALPDTLLITGSTVDLIGQAILAGGPRPTCPP